MVMSSKWVSKCNPNIYHHELLKKYAWQGCMQDVYWMLERNEFLDILTEPSSSEIIQNIMKLYKT